MAVRDGLGQHMRPGAGELERLGRQLLRELVIGGQVEDAIADFVRDDARGGGAEAHSLVGPERFDVADRVAGLDARHTGHEVVDHAVGLGVAGVETVQLSVGDKVDPGKLLRLENNGNGVAERCPRRVAVQPAGDGVAPNNSRLESHLAIILAAGHYLLCRRYRVDVDSRPHPPPDSSALRILRGPEEP